MKDTKSHAELHGELHGELQGLLVIMASLSHGLEEMIGRGAKSIVFRAGLNLGMKIDTPEKCEDPVKAIEIVQKALNAKGLAWRVTPFKPTSSNSYIYEKDNKKAMKIVCKNCMIRCALFRYGHEQEKSLCHMNNGEFSGVFRQITGKKATLEILHAGENACLKELVWTEEKI